MDSCCLPAETLLTFIKEYQTVATHDTNQHCHTHFYTWQGETTFDETSVYTVYCITIQLGGEIRLCELYCYHTIQDIMALTSLPNAMWVKQAKMLETNYSSLFNTDSSGGPL